MAPPLVLLHGFTDSPRTWDLVRPALERRHEVLAPALPGHASGPPLPEPLTVDAVVDEVERAMDAAGMGLADVAGNSLGGYVALRLAERGRARSVVALAPPGGWAPDDGSFRETLGYFGRMHEAVRRAAPHADAIAATPEGRRRATRETTVRWEHVPPDLVAHQIRAAAACAVAPMVDLALRAGYPLDASRIACPVRIVWGTADRLLPWPSAAHRYREALPQADWVELEDVGHCPQLDVPLEAAELVLGFTAPAGAGPRP